MSKVAIVGAGSVGATLAYNLTVKGVVNEIALIDANRERSEVEVMDIQQGSPLGDPVNTHVSDYSGCGDASVVVVTAGARQKPGETRIELLGRNAGIVRDITREVVSSGFKGILLMISNPVDVMTYVAYRVASAEADFTSSRVIGSGTVLDSARLREFLAHRCGINAMNIHGYVLGEHGDTSFPAWSLTTIGGVSMSDYCPVCERACTMEDVREEAEKYVRAAAYRIIQVKGSTYYAIAQAASIIVQAIVRNEKRILPVSTVRERFGDVEKTAFSVPTVVGSGGAERVLDLPLSEEDAGKLAASAGFVASVIREAGL